MKKSILVRNERGIESLTINFLPKLVRHDQMEDREFLVVPMVILTEGVHNGSGGPLYYPKEELSKTPASWNHKPVVVYHPEMNGQGISACDPTVISNRKVGVMMNTKFTKGKLTSEAWIEVTRANKIDDRIMQSIEANEMMEVSTGVFIDCDAEEGEWKGEPYVGIARNFRPDHLALLPDKIGACSIADGAGFLRNQNEVAEHRKMMEKGRRMMKKGQAEGDEEMEAKGKAMMEEHEEEMKAAMKKARISRMSEHGDAEEMMKRAKKMMAKAEEEDDEEMMKQGKAMMKKAKAMVALMAENEMSHSNISQSLTTALRDKFNANPPNGPYLFVENVYSNFVIYEFDGKLYRLGYMAGETSVTLSEDKPVEVKRVTEYRTTDGAFVGNTKPNTLMDKTKMVIAILAANIGFAETDRETLEKMTDEQIKGIHNGLPKAPAPSAQKGEKKEETEPKAPVDNQKAPEEKKIVTLEDYISSAPAPVQEVLRNSLSMYEEERAKLVEGIVLNKDNAFSKEDLQKKPLNELRNIARLAGVNKPQAPTIHYAGQGHVPATGNQEVEEPLATPVLNFAKAK